VGRQIRCRGCGIRQRHHRLKRVRRGLASAALAGCLLSGGAHAAPPANAAHQPRDKAAEPDDSLLEFLGQDDVDDAKWWEYFRHTSAQERDADEDPPPDEDAKP
jgi:hypothetical protein